MGISFRFVLLSAALYALGGLAHGQARRAIRFTKPGQAVAIANCAALQLTGPVTLEAWVRPEEDARHFPFKFILSKNYGGTGYALLMVGEDDESRFQFECNEVANFACAEPVVRNRWWHLAGVFDDGVQTLYLNGVKVSEHKSNLQMRSNPLPLWIGSSLWTNFRGSIADVRIWNVARTQAEIVACKDHYLTGRERGLVAYWPLSEGRGLIAHDATHHTRPGIIGTSFHSPFDGSDAYRTGRATKHDLPQWSQGPRLGGRPPRW